MQSVVKLSWTLAALIILLQYIPTADSQCTYQFTRQPPTHLNCSPLGTVIRLQCASSSTEDKVAWLWTRNKEHAGSNGTLVTNNLYQSVYEVSYNIHQLGVTVSESTLGYYWCEISNAVNVSLRPSTITPICPAPSNCLPKCTEQTISELHSSELSCAETEIPFFPPSLPDCSSDPNPTPTLCSPPVTTLLATSNSTPTQLMSTGPDPKVTVMATPPPTPIPFPPWVIAVVLVILVTVCLAIVVTLCCYLHHKRKFKKQGSAPKSMVTIERKPTAIQQAITVPLLLEREEEKAKHLQQQMCIYCRNYELLNTV